MIVRSFEPPTQRQHRKTQVPHPRTLSRLFYRARYIECTRHRHCLRVAILERCFLQTLRACGAYVGSRNPAGLPPAIPPLARCSSDGSRCCHRRRHCFEDQGSLDFVVRILPPLHRPFLAEDHYTRTKARRGPVHTSVPIWRLSGEDTLGNAAAWHQVILFRAVPKAIFFRSGPSDLASVNHSMPVLDSPLVPRVGCALHSVEKLCLQHPRRQSWVHSIERG